MGIDFLGLLLALLTAMIAAFVVVFLLTTVWSSLGLLALPLGIIAALFILALGATIHALLSSNNRS
jgi:hypothetical protein